jgi:hypothetical protein
MARGAEGVTGVYLLHFVPRYKHAGHYMGFAEDIGARVYAHEMWLTDVRLVRAAVAAGVSLQLARIWPGADRNTERKLKGGMHAKRTGSLARQCPICKESKRARC